MQKTVKSHHPHIYTLTFPSESQEKAFVIFGEHARELISVETGLHFVKTLCGMYKLLEIFQGLKVFTIRDNSHCQYESLLS